MHLDKRPPTNFLRVKSAVLLRPRLRMRRGSCSLAWGLMRLRSIGMHFLRLWILFCSVFEELCYGRQATFMMSQGGSTSFLDIYSAGINCYDGSIQMSSCTKLQSCGARCKVIGIFHGCLLGERFSVVSHSEIMMHPRKSRVRQKLEI